MKYNLTGHECGNDTEGGMVITKGPFMNKKIDFF